MCLAGHSGVSGTVRSHLLCLVLCLSFVQQYQQFLWYSPVSSAQSTASLKWVTPVLGCVAACIYLGGVRPGCGLGVSVSLVSGLLVRVCCFAKQRTGCDVATRGLSPMVGLPGGFVLPDQAGVGCFPA